MRYANLRKLTFVGMEGSSKVDECISKFNAGDAIQRAAAFDDLLKMDLPSILQNRSTALKVLKTWSSDEKFAQKIMSMSLLSILMSKCREWADINVIKHFIELLLFTQSTLKVTIDDDDGASAVGLASELICSESVGLSDMAGKLVELIVLNSERGAGSLLHKFVTTCSSLASKAGVCASTMKMRYCGVMSNILGSKGRDDLFEASLQHGAVQEIVNLCQFKADPLLQMNALNLLVAFAQTATGYKYLLDNDILTWLLDVSQPGDSGSADSMLLGPVALDTLAAIFNRAMACGVYSQDASSEKMDQRLMNLFIHTMTANVLSSHEQARLAGFNALVQFGTSSPAAAMTLSSSDGVIDALLGMLRSTKTEIKVAALCGFAELVRFEGVGSEATTVFTSSEDADMEITSARLFAKLARASTTQGTQDSLSYLLHVLHQPFSETRIAAMAVLGAAARWKWSIPIFFHSVKAAAFHDFLEGHTEHDKRGKEAKYGIVCALVGNPGFALLSEENQKFLRTIKNRGAFYVAPEIAEPQTI